MPQLSHIPKDKTSSNEESVQLTQIAARQASFTEDNVITTGIQDESQDSIELDETCFSALKDR